MNEPQHPLDVALNRAMNASDTCDTNDDAFADAMTAFIGEMQRDGGDYRDRVPLMQKLGAELADAVYKSRQGYVNYQNELRLLEIELRKFVKDPLWQVN